MFKNKNARKSRRQKRLLAICVTNTRRGRRWTRHGDVIGLRVKRVPYTQSDNYHRMCLKIYNFLQSGIFFFYYYYYFYWNRPEENVRIPEPIFRNLWSYNENANVFSCNYLPCNWYEFIRKFFEIRMIFLHPRFLINAHFPCFSHFQKLSHINI